MLQDTHAPCQKVRPRRYLKNGEKVENGILSVEDIYFEVESA